MNLWTVIKRLDRRTDAWSWKAIANAITNRRRADRPGSTSMYDTCSVLGYNREASRNKTHSNTELRAELQSNSTRFVGCGSRAGKGRSHGARP